MYKDPGAGMWLNPQTESSVSVARQRTHVGWAGVRWQGRGCLEREPEFMSSSLWALLSLLGPWKTLMGLKLGRKTIRFLFLKDHTGCWEEKGREGWGQLGGDTGAQKE